MRKIIVSRGDWLGNSANFKEICLCLRISTSRDIDPAQHCFQDGVRFRSLYSESLASRVLNCFRTCLVTKFERRLASELFYAMPGENCAVWGCGSCRRTKGLGIFKLPAAKDPEHKTWREAWLGEITKTREKDAEFQKLIDNDTVFTCEKHFKPDEIEICK